MKKLIINILTLAIAAVMVFGALIAYDEYKEAKKRQVQRIERCEKNDQIFETYLDHRFAEYAIGCFNDGYTLDVTFTYYDGMTKMRANWSNLNEDSFARLLTSDDYKHMKIERMEYGTYVAQYDSWRA